MQMVEARSDGKGWGDLLAGGRLPRFALICGRVWVKVTGIWP